MLIWHRRLWLIDHGATLYFHHSPGWESDADDARAPFPLIKEHVLLPRAAACARSTRKWPRRFGRDDLRGIVDLVPGRLAAPTTAPDRRRRADRLPRYLTERLAAPRAFVEEALRAR